MTEELTAFHTAFKEISDECREKSFPLPNSTDFGMGWRSAKEYYTRNDKAVVDEFLAAVREHVEHKCKCVMGEECACFEIAVDEIYAERYGK